MTLDKHDKWGMDKNKKTKEKTKKAPFVAFYGMRAVMFVLPDEMADHVMVLRLRWFILILRLNHGVSQVKWFPFQILFTSRKKHMI